MSEYEYGVQNLRLGRGCLVCWCREETVLHVGDGGGVMVSMRQEVSKNVIVAESVIRQSDSPNAATNEDNAGT